MTGHKCGYYRGLTVLLIVAACSSGCGASHSDQPASEPDAGRDATQTDPDETTDAGKLPPPPPRALTPEESEWAAATDFEIVLEQTSCYGTCPEYTMTLRETGDLRFAGHRHVWKPGTYDTEISANDAAMLYSDLILRGFVGLQASYQNPSDGCPLVVSDSPSSSFTLRAGGREKKVHYNEGCGDHPDRETLQAIQREILEVTNLAPFMRDSETCGFRPFGFFEMVGATYVLRDLTGLPVGVLRFGPADLNAQRDWAVSDCDGRELARGDDVGNWDCGHVVVPTIETRFLWPGMDSPQAAVVVDRGAGDTGQGNPPKSVGLRLFTFDGESAQSGERGDSCR
jgi:Domain of unknown function (DUF6438)